MPDIASMDVGSPPQSKGIPTWLLIGGAVAGIAGLVVLVMRNTQNNTTAAGTSINAALGSLQEEQMNLLGTTQQGILDINTNTNAQVAGAVNTLQSNEANYFTALQQQAQANNTQVTSQMSQLWDNVAAAFGRDQAYQQQTYGNLLAASGATQSQMQTIYDAIAAAFGRNSQEAQTYYNALSTQINSQSGAHLQSASVGTF